MLLHERTIVVRGYVRSDGCYDIETDLVDVKAHPFANGDPRGVVEPGNPVHRMNLAMTVDRQLTVHDCRAAISSSPYVSCNEISSGYAQVKGLSIGRGWRKKIESLFGGIRGCVHLREMLSIAATGAVQTMVPFRWTGEPDPEGAPPVDACHTYRREGAIAKIRWPWLEQKG